MGVSLIPAGRSGWYLFRHREARRAEAIQRHGARYWMRRRFAPASGSASLALTSQLRFSSLPG
ncbi:MAG: hypothetical protein ACLFPA_11375, partial [Dichotomicrobium sp.]